MRRGLKGFSLWARRWVPVLIWAALVLYASTSAGSSYRTAAWLRPYVQWFFPDLAFDGVHFLVRKAAHVLQFFVLVLLLWRAVKIRPALAVADETLVGVILFASLVLASASESIQIFSPHRGASVGDVALDLTGALLALAVIFGTRALRRTFFSGSGR